MDYDPGWPARFRETGTALRNRLGERALRMDHIGSTAVPGLAAKDVIDVQITVASLDAADAWPDELLPKLERRYRGTADDHVPPGADPDPRHWTKHYWSQRLALHVHVREDGRLNQRYALLFRDYLRADATAAAAYGLMKRALAEAAAPDDWDTYYAIKDPACDLIIAGAEQWALRTGWRPGPSDA
ncbi:MAG: GrpB family protein [Acidimicrobiia bacterium]